MKFGHARVRGFVDQFKACIINYISLAMFSISVQVHSETILFAPFAAGLLIFHNDDVLPLVLVYRAISQDSHLNQRIGHNIFSSVLGGL